MERVYIYMMMTCIFIGYGKEYFVKGEANANTPAGIDRAVLPLSITSTCPTCYAGDFNHPFKTVQYACERKTTSGITTFVLQAGDIVYIRQGNYYPLNNTYSPILWITEAVGTEESPITIRNFPNETPTFHPYTNAINPKDPVNSGSWALVKINPRVYGGVLKVPAYLNFEGIVFKGSAMTITKEEEEQYEHQKGSYCEFVDNEGYLNLGACSTMVTCQDQDGDGVSNDGNCEPVRYNGQGFLVTGPFAWDQEIKGLISRKNFPSTYQYAIPHHISVKKCVFKEFPGAGISFQRADYITIENCEVANNCWYTIFGSSGINFYQMVPWQGANTNYALDNDYRIKVINNICYGNMLKVKNQNLVVRYDGNGIIIDDFAHEQDYRPLSQINSYRASLGLTPVQKNPTNPNRGNFYYGRYGGKTLVANNILFGNGGSGLKVYSCQYVDVINNTLYNNGIGNYRNFRFEEAEDHGWLRAQNSLFVQAIVDETEKTQPRATIIPGYNRVLNNISYNTLGYPSDWMPAEYLAFHVADSPFDYNVSLGNYHNLTGLGNPHFSSVPNLQLEIPSEVSYFPSYFKLLSTSQAINYGKYLSEVQFDMLQYTRDALPDAGAYETPTPCIERISVGSNYSTLPPGQSSSILSTERKVLRAQKSITLNHVFVTQQGAVFSVEVASCNASPNVSARRDFTIEHYNLENSSLEAHDNNFAYPNPVSNGIIYLYKPVYNYQLFNVAGEEISSGGYTEQIDVRDFRQGLYLLKIDGETQKIVIQ